MSDPSYIKPEFFKSLILEGKIKSQIATTMKLEQASEAQDISKGGVNGKLVLEIS